MKKLEVIAIAFLIFGLLGGCEKAAEEPVEDESAEAKTEEQAPTADKLDPGTVELEVPAGELEGPPASAEVTTRLREALSTYEELRAALASGNLEGVADKAEQLERSAAMAQKSAEPGAQERIVALARAAKALKTTARDGELKEVRAAFGPVSKGMVASLDVAPGLAKGLNVFECPRVDGYQKWVQAGEEPENPYMDDKGRPCGQLAESAR